LCKQSIQAFQAENFKSQAAIKPTVIDILDQNFHQRGAVIYCINESNCALDFDAKFGFYKESKKESKTVTDESALVKQTVLNSNPADFVKLFYSECQRESTSREVFQRVWREYSGKYATPEAIPESHAFEFLDRLTSELEREFLSSNLFEKFGNKVIFNPRRLSQFPAARDFKEREPRTAAPQAGAGLTGAPAKGFSTFIGSQRNNSNNSLSYNSRRNYSNTGDKDQAKVSPFKDFIRKAVKNLVL